MKSVALVKMQIKAIFGIVQFRVSAGVIILKNHLVKAQKNAMYISPD